MKNRLKLFRVLRDRTQAQLGHDTGKSQSWVARLEAGEIEPSLRDIALICNALEADPEDVFPRSDEEVVNEYAK